MEACRGNFEKCGFSGTTLRLFLNGSFGGPEILMLNKSTSPGVSDEVNIQKELTVESKVY